ncbi:hypothetical protein H4F18_18700 [Vibrio scophthalmi]|uniref:hypothetical protein n=1 Tax=Vibrio scophthalmi TaxID=45658 RepID=UPI002FF21E82
MMQVLGRKNLIFFSVWIKTTHKRQLLLEKRSNPLAIREDKLEPAIKQVIRFTELIAGE